jgi:hypothetical protein
LTQQIGNPGRVVVDVFDLPEFAHHSERLTQLRQARR